MIPVHDSGGEPSGFIGSLTDITERVQAEEALQASQQRLLQAQRVAGLGFLSWDLRSDEITLSDQAMKIFKVRSEEHTSELQSH